MPGFSFLLDSNGDRDEKNLVLCQCETSHWDHELIRKMFTVVTDRANFKDGCSYSDVTLCSQEFFTFPGFANNLRRGWGGSDCHQPMITLWNVVWPRFDPKGVNEIIKWVWRCVQRWRAPLSQVWEAFCNHSYRHLVAKNRMQVFKHFCFSLIFLTQMPCPGFICLE